MASSNHEAAYNESPTRYHSGIHKHAPIVETTYTRLSMRVFDYRKMTAMPTRISLPTASVNAHQ